MQELFQGKETKTLLKVSIVLSFILFVSCISTGVGTQETTVNTGKIQDGNVSPSAASQIVTTSEVPSTLFSNVTTFAGNGTSGFTDAAGTNAQFRFPSGIAADSTGNLYVADMNNNKIRKITVDGVVSTLAGIPSPGSRDGAGSNAQFIYPTGIAVDSTGNLYVADTVNDRIRKVTSDGTVTTFAGSGTYGYNDGTGTSAQFRYPTGIAVDSSGNLYIADQDSNRIRKVTSGGVVTTLAGDGTSGSKDGTGTNAQFNKPYGIAVDSTGVIYVSDRDNHNIRKITSDNAVTTFSGTGTSGFNDGSGTIARFNSPTGMALDSTGNLYISDSGNNKIRKIVSGVVSTLAGSGTFGSKDGTGDIARFYSPMGLTVDSAGNVFVADCSNHKIRKISK